MKRTPRRGGMTLCVALCLPIAAWAEQGPAAPSRLVVSVPAEFASTRAQAPIASSAAGTHGLSLRQALDLAFIHNPDLAAATLEVAASEGIRQQAGVYPNPELSYLQEDTQRATRTMTLQLNQPIELGGKRDARLAIAERGHALATEDLVARRQAIHAAVTTAFFDTLAAQERVRVMEEAVDLAARATRAASLRVQAGKVAPIEETKAQVAEAGVQVEANQARSELRGAQARLAALLGQGQSRALVLDGRFNELPATSSREEIQRQLENSPALRRARLEIERHLALTELEKARRIPDLTVSVGAKRDEAFGRNQAIVGVSIPLPLFDRNQGNLLEALKREDKARQALRAAQLQVSADALQARERLESARMEAELLSARVLPGAQSAYETAVKGFELGKFSFLETLDAQRTLLQARMQSLRATADAHRARAELDRILGSGDVEPTATAPAPR